MSHRTCDVPNCTRPHNARGYCFGHYDRWKKLGHPDESVPLNTKASRSATLLERILHRIDKGLSENECWEWRGAIGGRKGERGYGKLTVNGKQVDAHRAMWEIHNGATIPKGGQVMHDCDNPSCVNPSHLSLGDNDKNVADMVAKRRHTFGERNPRAKLTEDAVIEIRSSKLDDRELADKFGVGAGTIRRVRAGRSWRHV